MLSTPATTIDLLRHGQTTADNILRGQIDVSLTALGYQQMLDKLASQIKPRPPWQQLISSPLQRCAQFARDLSREHSLALKIDNGFMEMNFGDWDGRPFKEIEEENPELFNKIWQQPEKYCPPNGETFLQFSQRISSAWQTICQQYSNQHILLICHGGVIRALLAHIMQTPLSSLSRIDVPYGCLSRIQIHHQQGQPDWPQLVFHNAQ